MNILLFDIDGTLVLSGNAGRTALEIAFECVHGIPHAGHDLPFDGKTDPSIYNEICSLCGIIPTPHSRAEFLRRYLFALRRLAPVAPAAKVIPGAKALIESAKSLGMIVGLLTGNIREGARVKLDRFKLWEYFRFGAFGDEAGTREEIAELALVRGREAAGDPSVPAENFVVIGDTPHDVACGKRWDMRTLGVGSGLHYTVKDLENAGADLALPDLTDDQRIISWIQRK